MRRARVAIVAWSLACAARLLADQTSLCLTSEQGCMSPAGIAVQVRLGETDGDCVGGQFLLQYDPQKLQLVDASPGSACDSTSPFLLELFEDNDPLAGELFYAAGINFLRRDGGVPGPPAALACLTFAPVGGMDASTDFCVLEGTGPRSTVLVNDQGMPVPIDNSVDCPAAVPLLACDDVMIQSQCMCTPNTADCHALDTDCRVGVCNKVTHFCGVAPINEGGPCDDGDSCTLVDRCESGVCVGAGCTTSSLCPLVEGCSGLSEELMVRIQLTTGTRVISGGQFSLTYDPLELDFVDIAPGSTCDPGSPFSVEVSQMADETSGMIFYAVGTALGGPPGTSGPATFACLHFLDIGNTGGDVCMFDDVNPLVTILVDEFGQGVSPGTVMVCPQALGNPPTACAIFEVCRIPTLSEWGLINLTILLLIGAKVVFAGRRPAAQAA